MGSWTHLISINPGTCMLSTQEPSPVLYMFQGSFGQKFGCATWLLYFFLFSVNWPIYRFFRLTTLGVLKCKMLSLFLSEARSFSTQLNRQKNKKKRCRWTGLAYAYLWPMETSILLKCRIRMG